MPVAATPDGAVVNLYGVGGCPTTVFSARGRQGRGVPSSGQSTEDGLRARGRAGSQRGLRRARPRAASRAGSTPSWRRSSPSSRLATRAWRRGSGRSAATSCASACAGSGQPHHRRPRDPHAPGPGALGLPGVLAPGGHRSRHRPHARSSRSRSTGSSGAGCAAATCSTTRSRSPRWRPGCRWWRSTPRRSGTADRSAPDRRRRAAGRLRAARCRAARSWSPTRTARLPCSPARWPRSAASRPTTDEHGAGLAPGEGRAR